MEQNNASHRREITIDSNWIVSIGLGLLFAACCWVLISSVRNLTFDRVDEFSPLTMLLVAAYSFLSAYSFPAKPLKFAFLLMGSEKVVRIALHYLHASTNIQRLTAVVASFAGQIALVIILVAIFRWFRSVVRWNQSAAQEPRL
jgi:hypothetical protein